MTSPTDPQDLAHVAAYSTARAFESVTQQRGLYWYSGLTPSAVDELRDQHHIYVGADGRVCVAALQAQFIPRVARAIAVAFARHGSRFVSAADGALSPTACDVEASAALVCDSCGLLQHSDS